MCSCVCVLLVVCRYRCLICQCDFEVGEELRRLPCNHSFHTGENNATTTSNRKRNTDNSDNIDDSNDDNDNDDDDFMLLFLVYTGNYFIDMIPSVMATATI